MEHVFWNIGHKLKMTNIVKSEGCYLYDDAGMKYVDMESGVWCTPLGHCNREVNNELKLQSDKIAHTGYCYSSPIVEDAAKSVLKITDMADGQCVFLSSGSEAVVFGLQTMMQLSEKSKLLCLTDSFLGSYGLAKKNHSEEWYLFDWLENCQSCSDFEATLNFEVQF
jgi:acetylornithine/N-succinyldiaminopimelate aminotransferase